RRVDGSPALVTLVAVSADDLSPKQVVATHMEGRFLVRRVGAPDARLGGYAVSLRLASPDEEDAELLGETFANAGDRDLALFVARRDELDSLHVELALVD